MLTNPLSLRRKWKLSAKQGQTTQIWPWGPQTQGRAEEAPYWIQRLLLMGGLYPKQWTRSLLSPAGSQKTGNPLSITQESDAWRQLHPSKKNTHRYRCLDVIQIKIFKKSLLNVLLYCFCFTFWFFGHKAGRILAPRIPPAPGIKPTPPASEGSLYYWTARDAPDSKLLKYGLFLNNSQ